MWLEATSIRCICSFAIVHDRHDIITTLQLLRPTWSRICLSLIISREERPRFADNRNDKLSLYMRSVTIVRCAKAASNQPLVATLNPSSMRLLRRPIAAIKEHVVEFVVWSWLRLHRKHASSIRNTTSSVGACDAQVARLIFNPAMSHAASRLNNCHSRDYF